MTTSKIHKLGEIKAAVIYIGIILFRFEICEILPIYKCAGKEQEYYIDKLFHF